MPGVRADGFEQAGEVGLLAFPYPLRLSGWGGSVRLGGRCQPFAPLSRNLSGIFPFDVKA